MTKTTQYSGDMIFENNVLKRILVDGGYIEDGVYYFYVTGHLGNNYAVVSQNGEVVQKNRYYPGGMSFADDFNQSKQPYKYSGKELDPMHGLNLYDSKARWQDPAIFGRFLTPDPLAEKYYSISPYVYCANNPIRYIDPTGMEIDLSQMSEEERNQYSEQIAERRENSGLFNTMYSSLESSKDVYVVKFGETHLDKNGNFVDGQFVKNAEGGGAITFLNSNKRIKVNCLSEELFHAYQHDNRSKYESGEFNIEFEAKSFTTAVGIESGIGYLQSNGMADFQFKIDMEDYGNARQIISPEIVISSPFVKDYMQFANSYANYNKKNNIGNIYYKMGTTVFPYSLQKIVIDTYTKK